MSDAVAAQGRRRYLIVLAVLFGLEWIALAIRPRYRADWALENALVVVAVGALMLSARRVLLSRLSYTLIFVFLSLHEVGAHYTYSEVPYDAWFQALTGRSFNALLGWDRNHFDRFVHFGYGVLLAYPAHELFRRAVGVRGAWAYLVPLQGIMTLSVTYELIEWAAALVFGGDLGIAYVGAQGDVWDGQKDMALAGAGGLLGLGATALGNRRRPASRGTGVDRVGRTA